MIIVSLTSSTFMAWQIWISIKASHVEISEAGDLFDTLDKYEKRELDEGT
jgi:hypothetical protein